MYKIMLADDEGIVIDSLKFIIEKEYGSECEIRTAKTGRSVIELAEDFQPDIAFMDIQMPGINGIEAMREIKKVNKHTVFIVMTAYDKFDYAKEAINLGVLDYLNKPVTKEKIINTLSRAMEIIDSERTKRSNDLMIKEKLETVVPIIENGLIQDLLFKEHFQEDVDNYKTLLSITEDYGYMAVLVLGQEQVGNYMTGAVPASIQAQKYYRDIRTITDDYLPGVMGAIMSNKIPILMPCNEPTLSYNDRSGVIENARALCRKLSERLELNFRVGFGSVKDLSHMAESYEEAISSLVQTKNKVAHVDDMPTTPKFEENYPIDLEKKLFEKIQEGDVASSEDAATNYFQWMCTAHAENVNDIKLKVLEFALWAEHISYERTGEMYQFNSRSDYLPTIMGMNDMAELKNWFLQKVRYAADAIAKKRSEGSMGVVAQAKKYIDENYNKEISLDDVSRVVDISPYYFSKVFKEEMGENFIDYLTKLRIDKAKELLLTTTMSMKEIAREVGYTDPNYFSRNFKKYTGKTPTDYSKGNA